MRILLIEDETDLVAAVAREFRACGFSVDAAHDGEEGLVRATGTDYDAIVLDLMLPAVDGWTVLERLRQSKKTPVLLLTARDGKAEKIRGLNAGADDYLTKPFDVEELVARVRALVRRSSGSPSPLICFGDVKVDTVARSVWKAGEPVTLRGKEYALLELLLLNRGKLVTRSTIYEHIYGEDDDTLSNVVDVYVSNLRRKLGHDLIETRRGEGYIIRG